MLYFLIFFSDDKKSDSGESENEDSEDMDEEKNEKVSPKKSLMNSEPPKKTSNISATYICYTNNCNKKFTKLANMYDHEEQEHNKKRKFDCLECGKSLHLLLPNTFFENFIFCNLHTAQ